MATPRKWRSYLANLVALVTLGSGVENLFSVLHPVMPHRIVFLEDIFPLEFVHISRLATLLIGLALIASSYNIYKRKKRAYYIVFFLSCFSIVFHLTKGLNYEEALLSAVVLLILFLTRDLYTARSAFPNWRESLIRLVLVLLFGFTYSVVGFWLLDPREFGINFTIGDALHRSVLFFTLIGDPQLVPYTRHARFFLDSLSVTTFAILGYAVFAVFHPIVYQLHTLPQERATVGKILENYGRCSLDFFKLWPDKSYFFSPSQRCFLAYRVANSFAVVLADPVGPDEEIENSIKLFSQFCNENDWRLGFHQTLPDYLPIYKRLGFRKLKIGDVAYVDLTRFSLEGKNMKQIRNKVHQLEKEGIRTMRQDPPIPDEIFLQAKEISDEWLRIPGRRERTFSLGMFEPGYIRSTPLFFASDSSGKMLGFVNIVRSFRKEEGAIDLMRRREEVPNGLMDYLFVKLFLHLREKGFQRFDFGMAPMSGFREREDATREERAVHYFFQHLNFLFSYRGLRAYKSKFASFWEPRYVVYRTTFDLPKLGIALGKISRVGNKNVNKKV